MFKCYDCGRIFEYPEVRSESRGEFWGMPAYEDIDVCPYCHSDEIDDLDENEEENEDD